MTIVRVMCIYDSVRLVVVCVYDNSESYVYL